MANAAQSAAQIGAQKQKALDRASREKLAAESLAYDKFARAAGYDHDRSMQDERHLNAQTLQADEIQAAKDLMVQKNQLEYEMAHSLKQDDYDSAWAILQLQNKKDDQTAHSAMIRRFLMIGPPGMNPQEAVAQEYGRDPQTPGGIQGGATGAPGSTIPFNGQMNEFTNAVNSQGQSFVQQAISAQNGADVATHSANDLIERTSSRFVQALMLGEASIDNQTLGLDSGMATHYWNSMGRGVASFVSNVGGLTGLKEMDPGERAKLWQEFKDSEGLFIDPTNVLAEGQMSSAGVGILDTIYEIDKYFGQGNETLFGSTDPTPSKSPERMAQDRFTKDYVMHMKEEISQMVKEMAPTPEHEVIYMEEAEGLFNEAVSLLGSPEQSEENRALNIKKFVERSKKLNEYYTSGEGKDPIRSSARNAALTLFGNIAYGLEHNLRSSGELGMYNMQLDAQGKPLNDEKAQRRRAHHGEFVRQLKGLSTVMDYMTKGVAETPRDKIRHVNAYKEVQKALLTHEERVVYGQQANGDPFAALDFYRDSSNKVRVQNAQNGALEGFTDAELTQYDRFHFGDYNEDEINIVVDKWVTHAVQQVNSAVGDELPQVDFPSGFHLMMRTPYAQDQIHIANVALMQLHDRNQQIAADELGQLQETAYHQTKETRYTKE